MSDRVAETETVEPPAEPPRPTSERRSRWRGAVRWFAAEFLVVVSGVWWQLGFYSDPRPVLGTVSMLIATGDVRLIRDSRLRSEIVAYAGSMAMDMEDLGRSVTRLTQATDAERRKLERDGVPRLFPAFGATRAVLPGSYEAEQVDRVLPRYLAIWPVVQAIPSCARPTQSGW